MDSQYFILHIHCTAILTWACHIPTTGHTGVSCALRTPGPSACPASKSGKRSARDAPHAESDPAVARARPRRPPQTRRASAGGAPSPSGPRKCAALIAATALHRLKVKSRPRGRRGCGSLSAPPASRDLQAESEIFRKSQQGPGGMEGEPRSRAPGRHGARALRSRRRTEQTPRAPCRLSIASPCASRHVAM